MNHNSAGTFLFLGLMAFILFTHNTLAQNPRGSESIHPKWIEAGFGIIGEPGIKVMNFPAYSFNMEGGYKINPVILSAKFCYSKEMVMAMDYGPGTQLRDGGVLIGKYLIGGKNGKRILLFSAGMGLLWAKHTLGSPFNNTYKVVKITTYGFPLEAKFFWTQKKTGWGFAVNGNINPKISYCGGSLIFLMGLFK